MMICREKVVGAFIQVLRRSLFLGTYSRFFSWQVWCCIVGVSWGNMRLGSAGTVCCVMVVRGEFRSGQVRQVRLVELG